MLTHKQRLTDCCWPALIAVGLLALGRVVIAEPLGLALWCVIVAWLCVPLMLDDSWIVARRYVAAAGVIVFAAVLFAGVIPAIVVAAVAFSLIGNVWLLVACRVPAALAIGFTLVVTALAFTWPIWAATLLTRVDTEPWLQWLINLSPAFALNALIAPEDPLTHRPLAYHLMNLGQDVMYSMPISAWPCVALHAAVGVAGMIGRGWTQMNADEKNVSS